MEQERKINLDIAKGIGILTVSFYHLVYRPKDSLADKLIRESIWMFIPMFFFISGFLHKRQDITLKQKISHRLEITFIPTLKLSVVLVIIGSVYCVIFHEYTLQNIIQDIGFIYLRPEIMTRFYPEFDIYCDGIVFQNISATWFIWTMTLTIFLFFPIVDYVRDNLRNLILTVLIMLTLGTIMYDYKLYFSWNLALVPVFAAVMFCGAFLADYISAMKINLFAAVIAFAVHFAMFYFVGCEDAVYTDVGTIGKWSVPVYFIQLFIGGYVLIVICKLINAKSVIIKKFLVFVGQNSLDFMLLHCFFAVGFVDLMHTVIKSKYWYLDVVTPEIFIKSLISWILSLLCCSLFCIIKKRLKRS